MDLTQTDSELAPEKLLHNPLYGDAQYTYTDVRTSAKLPDRTTSSGVYAYAVSERSRSHSCATAGVRGKARKIPEGYEVSEALNVRHVHSDAGMGYSSLNPVTQYASLEPFTGQKPPEKAQDLCDYCHLNH